MARRPRNRNIPLPPDDETSWDFETESRTEWDEATGEATAWDGGITQWDDSQTEWDADVSLRGRATDEDRFPTIWDDGDTDWDEGGATGWWDQRAGDGGGDGVSATEWDDGTTEWDKQEAGITEWDDGTTRWDVIEPPPRPPHFPTVDCSLEAMQARAARINAIKDKLISGVSSVGDRGRSVSYAHTTLLAMMKEEQRDQDFCMGRRPMRMVYLPLCKG